MRQRTGAQAGFTLVELMISLVLFSFAVVGVLAVAVSLTQGYREQRLMIAAEGAVRVPLDFIADALRQASPGVPIAENIQDAATCSVGAIDVTNNTNAPDQLELIYASGAVVTSTRTVWNAGATAGSITVNDASELAQDDYILITNLTKGHLVKITAVSGNDLTLATVCGSMVWPTNGYDIGSLVIRAQHARFYIADHDGISSLWFDGDGDLTSTSDQEPLAVGIEDMQVAIGIDGNDDGTITEDGTATDEWIYNNNADTPHNAASDKIRAVRVTLVSRSTVPLIGGGALYYRPGAEDRGQSTAQDAYRRRVLRTTVELRNIGGSP